MASTQDFADFVTEQVGLAGRVSSRKMFGEFALYVDGKVVALICDNQVFVKPTAEGRRILGEVTEAPPYPGAKPHFEVGEHLDDRDLLSRLLLATAAALPVPKPRSKAKSPSKTTRKPKAASKTIPNAKQKTASRARRSKKAAAKKSPRGKA